MFGPVNMMIGTMSSQYLEILAFEGNPTSYVQDDDRNNISSVLAW